MPEPAANTFRSRGPSQTVHADRGPIVPRSAARTVVSKLKQRMTRYFKRTTPKSVTIVTLFLATLIIFVLLLLGPIAHLIAGEELSLLTTTDRFEALNGIRQTLIAATAGFAASTGLAITGRTYALSKRGQEIDSFVRAASLLASQQQPERTAGLLTMEQMIRENTRGAHSAVEVIRSFIHDHAHVDPETYESALNDPRQWEHEEKCPQDVSVAMTILGYNSPLPKRFMLDLSKIDIRHIGLAGSKFPAVKFFGCMMQGASFVGADLRSCRLDRSIMRGAWLKETDLRRATLRDVDLRGADLTDAKVYAEQLLPAVVDDSTVLDDAVRTRLQKLRDQVSQQTRSAATDPTTRSTE